MKDVKEVLRRRFQYHQRYIEAIRSMSVDEMGRRGILTHRNIQKEILHLGKLLGVSGKEIGVVERWPS